MITTPMPTHGSCPICGGLTHPKVEHHCRMERRTPEATEDIAIAWATEYLKDEGEIGDRWSEAITIIALAAERDALRAELEVATATLEDEEAGHAETLQLLDAQRSRESVLAEIGEAQKERADRAEAALRRAVAALSQIGCWDDEPANARLVTTGSYSSFDEPRSVEIARKATADLAASTTEVLP